MQFYFLHRKAIETLLLAKLFRFFIDFFHNMVNRCFLCKWRTDKYPQRSFHKFPSNNELRQKWLDILGKSNVDIGRRTSLCNLHFEDDCFRIGLVYGRRVLKKGSLPTLHLIKSETSNPNSLELQHPITNTVQTKDRTSDLHTDSNLVEVPIEICLPERSPGNSLIKNEKLNSKWMNNTVGWESKPDRLCSTQIDFHSNPNQFTNCPVNEEDRHTVVKGIKTEIFSDEEEEISKCTQDLKVKKEGKINEEECHMLEIVIKSEVCDNVIEGNEECKVTEQPEDAVVRVGEKINQKEYQQLPNKEVIIKKEIKEEVNGLSEDYIAKIKDEVDVKEEVLHKEYFTQYTYNCNAANDVFDREEMHKELKKELKRKRNCERQRAYYHRQKDLKKNEEKKIKKVPKTNAERQREFRQRKAEKSYGDIAQTTQGIGDVMIEPFNTQNTSNLRHTGSAREIKEKKRKRNQEYQRAWRQRQKDLKKKDSKEEKEAKVEKKRKKHRENQRAYYQRTKRKFFSKENYKNVEELSEKTLDDLQM
ncbi:glutamic acid-rich protein-like isoform X4 [Leptidea sinapis]|nr:glutamic acid-rich protein-like isoform X4 [Leptidea sinapis]